MYYMSFNELEEDEDSSLSPTVYKHVNKEILENQNKIKDLKLFNVFWIIQMRREAVRDRPMCARLINP